MDTSASAYRVRREMEAQFAPVLTAQLPIAA
jgi:hypothetical protein